MLKKKPIIMDVDTGVDDTLALLLVAAAENLELKAITTVFGNCSLETTTENTLKICELLGLDVPVAAGAYRPARATSHTSPSCARRTATTPDSRCPSGWYRRRCRSHR